MTSQYDDRLLPQAPTPGERRERAKANRAAQGALFHLPDPVVDSEMCSACGATTECGCMALDLGL